MTQPEPLRHARTDYGGFTLTDIEDWFVNTPHGTTSGSLFRQPRKVTILMPASFKLTTVINAAAYTHTSIALKDAITGPA